MSDLAHTSDELWLGFDNLAAPFPAISAVLVYAPVWDRRIAQSYGSVPGAIQAVVLLTDGRVLPSRRSLADLHARWLEWQRRHQHEREPPGSSSSPTDEQP